MINNSVLNSNQTRGNEMRLRRIPGQFSIPLPEIKKCNVSRLTELTEIAFDHFNVELFEGKLTRPAITIQADAGTYGWVSVFPVWVNGEKQNAKRELNLTANYLKRNRFERWATLLHEMVHLKNLQNGILDVTPSNGYHQKKTFGKECKKIGLDNWLRKDGWSGTAIAPYGKAHFALQGLAEKVSESEFEFQRGNFIPDPEDIPKTPTGKTAPNSGKKGRGSGNGSNNKKWSCGCQNARVAIADFSATCNKCGNDFVMVD
jgi:hypothetical protein